MSFSRWPSRAIGSFVAISALSMALIAPVSSADDSAAKASSGVDRAKVDAARSDAIDFLRTTQSDDGSWTSPTAPGISGLVATALLKSGAIPADPIVARALLHLATFVQKDGGIYY